VAARALHVHRNTLDYRLRRIHEITGLNPAQDEERMMLYLALELE
jgi:carbohydrate diacid regulator